MFSEHVQSSRARQREQTRERILDCAQQLFGDRGYRETTVRAIAEAAQVSVGSVMAVGDKDALLLAAYDRWIGAVHDGRPAGLPPSAASTPERIGQVVAPFVELFAGDVDLSRHYAAVLARGGASSEVFGTLAVTLLGEFTQVMAEGGAVDPEATAKALYFSYLGLLLAGAAVGDDLSMIVPELEGIARALLGPGSTVGESTEPEGR